jgi:Bacterial Ig-like domain (group 3)
MRTPSLAALTLASVLALAGASRGQIVSTFGGNAQHTGNYSAAAQDMNAIHWSASIDLNNTGAFAHYGAPLITPANTIIVPQKTGANGGFQINVFNAANGTALYTLATDYIVPSHNWIPAYSPGLAVNSTDTRLYYPGAGGTIYYIDNPDSVSHGAPVQQVFYTTLANYQANASAFNSSVFINTPITSDSSGDIFFGFRVQGTAPAPLSTTQSGYARIDPNGNATYVLAATAANDSNIGQDSHNSAPALSNDQTTLYGVVKGASTDTYGYLLGLDSTTLATKYKVFLKDPRSNNANNAEILDDGTASPMVGPDGDVYFGIMGNPFNGSRGFMLHFSGDLTVEKTPGGFGWDNTAAIVPASMVPSYTGSSSYLLFTKYNNYADGGNDNGDGINRIAILDPNATEVDAHSSSNGMLIMREVMTMIGPTADAELRNSSFPHAIREWCINTAAVNPATNSVITPSEDGRTYRWNLTTNSLTEWVQLGPGVGQPYVPTVIGPDGTVFTMNGGTMWALGNLNGVGVALASSTPDAHTVVAGQSLTFTASVTNTGTSGITPTGTVTFTDTTYAVVNSALQTTTTTLAANVPLDSNGHATFSSSSLSADFHFITVQYSGDSNFSAGSSSLVQTIHGGASSTAIASTPNPSTTGQSVTFTATVTSVPPATGTPTGQVTFQQGNTVLAQAPVNSSGVVSFSTSALAAGSDTITATYASDFLFAVSSGSSVQIVQSAFATTTTVSSSPNPSVFGQSVTFTATVSSGNGTPVGTVTFTEGSNVLASNVTVDGSGHAAFSTSALAAGSHTITATFTGGAGWGNSSGSDSASPQVVNKDATTTALSSSANPSVFSQPVMFTAAVTANSPGSGVPTGTVTFKNGSSTLGTSTLDGTGHATFTTSTLTVAAHSITAVYNGDSNFNISTSSTLTQTVNKDATTSSVTSSLNPSTRHQSVTFTATVAVTAPGTAVPTGSVAFKDGTTTLSTKTLNSSGQATFSTSSLARGSHSITVVYAGSSNSLTSTSPILVQTVN